MTVLVDLVAMLGFSAIVYGVWLINEPAAFIVGGIFKLVISFLLSLSLKVSKKK